MDLINDKQEIVKLKFNKKIMEFRKNKFLTVSMITSLSFLYEL